MDPIFLLLLLSGLAVSSVLLWPYVRTVKLKYMALGVLAHFSLVAITGVLLSVTQMLIELLIAVVSSPIVGCLLQGIFDHEYA